MFGKPNEEVFLGMDISQRTEYSEATAQSIDKEIRRILSDAAVILPLAGLVQPLGAASKAQALRVWLLFRRKRLLQCPRSPGPPH
jgi:hypothetical protein